MFSIIQANPQYLNNIYSMMIALAQHEGICDKIKITESQLSELLFCEKPNHFVTMALNEGELVGFAMYNLTHHNVTVNVVDGFYIENLYVMPDFRNHGIGTSLLKYVAKIAKESNKSRIEWWVARHNSKAQNFYKKIGAIALSDWNVYKCDTVCMEKLSEA